MNIAKHYRKTTPLPHDICAQLVEVGTMMVGMEMVGTEVVGTEVGTEVGAEVGTGGYG